MIMCLCIFQTWQYAEGIIPYDRMTKAYYWRVFGKTYRDPANDKYLLKDKFLGTDTIMDGENFIVKWWSEKTWMDLRPPKGNQEDSLMMDTIDSYPIVVLDSTRTFFTIWEEPAQKLSDKYYAYVRIEGEINNPAGLTQNPVELIRTLLHEEKLYAYDSKTISANTITGNSPWMHFTYDYVLPDIRSDLDVFKAYFWLRGSKTVYLKNIQIKLLEAKEFPELE